VLEALQNERERAKQPNYACTYDDVDEIYAESRLR